MLDREGDDYWITAAVLQRARAAEADLLDEFADVLANRLGNAVARAFAGD